jgi:hypothetical protein
MNNHLDIINIIKEFVNTPGRQLECFAYACSPRHFPLRLERSLFQLQPFNICPENLDLNVIYTENLRRVLKTTITKILATILLPAAGHAEVLGLDAI